MKNDEFHFTVTDLARFLDKSAATIRSWEQKKLIEIPRLGVDRKLTCEEVREVAKWARSSGRINDRRLRLVEATVTLLTLVEEGR